jgi:predicted transcriptional regulator
MVFCRSRQGEPRCQTKYRLRRWIEKARPTLLLHMSAAIRLGRTNCQVLISTVYRALVGLGKPATETAIERTPAVSIRQSVHRDYVVCLDCGWRGQMLKRHLATGHGLSVEQYRVRWTLPREHPITAPSYSERRSGLAKQIGLGRGRGRRASREEPESAAPETVPAPQSQSRRRGRPRSVTTTT